MEMVDVRRRASPRFLANGTSYERIPAYRSDGTKIDNEFEWQLAETVILGMQAAKMMIVNDIEKKRDLGNVDGHTTNLTFHFTVWRDSPVSTNAPNGSGMAIVCDVVKKEGKARE